MQSNSITLRPYQQAAVLRLQSVVAKGTRRVLIVCPTGGGKTLIASHVIAQEFQQGRRVLFLAHRRELINQTYRKLLDAGLTEECVGVIMATDARRRPTAPVQVASIDTLRYRARPPADVVFVDESHRALAASYRTVAAEYPAALHIGLTATPYRADGRGLGDAYDELIVVASPRELIAEGFLVEPRVFTVPTEERADLSHVRVTRGEYSASDLDDAMNRQGLVGNIVAHWQTHAPQVRTVVFAVSIDHSRNIVKRFQEAGVPAEHLDGTTPTAERDAILRRLDSGETLVVGSVGTLSEGWDQPSVKCAVLARPTKSTGLYLQQVGRILRPWNGQRAIVLDHAGCVLEHGLPQADREFTLETKPKARPGQAPVRACPACFRVVGISTPRCPQCGYELIAERDFPKELAGELVEVTAPIAPPKSRTPSTRDVSELLRAAARAGRSVPWSAVSALSGTSRK